MANKFFKASMGVTIVMLIGYMISFFKESVIANYFGAGSNVDAYTIAIQIPVELFTFVTVSVQSIVVPMYSKFYYNNGVDDSKKYLDHLITIIVIISFLIIMVCEIGASGLVYLFAPGFDISTHNLSVELLRIVFPSVLFSVICQVLVAVLNVHKQFVINSLSLYFMNICTIVGTILFHVNYGIYAAAVGLLIGNILKCLFVVVLASKYYKYSFAFSLHERRIWHTLRQSVPIFWSMSIAEVTTMINKIVASFLFVGAISVLTYAAKINTILMQLFVSAIATIVYPMYAESTAKNDFNQLNRRINLTISGFSLFVIPLMVGIFVFKTEIVTIAFGRGAFDESAIERTQKILGFYSIGLLFMSLRASLTNIFYSLEDTKTPSINATWGAFVNIILNLTLPFIMGEEGLALAASITAAYITINLLIKLTKKYPEIILRDFYVNLKGIIVSSLVLLVSMLVYQYVCSSFTLTLRLFGGIILGLLIYFIMLQISQVPIMKLFISMLKQKIN